MARMTILAKTHKGQEYIYAARSAHKVSSKKAGESIAAVLNEIHYKLNDGEIWYAYTVDEYDTAYDWGSYQKFTISKTGLIREYA